MTIRDLIEQLQEIERRGGERLDVVVVQTEFEDCFDDFGAVSSQHDVFEAFYAGGSLVELRT